MAKAKSAPLRLQKSAQAKSQAAFERASEAIKSLAARELPIDFKTGAREGGVSVAFLYKNGGLKMLIDELRAAQKANRCLSSLDSTKLEVLTSDQSAGLRRLREENDELRKVNQQLSKQNQELKAQSSLIAALELQIYRLTKEKNLLMKKIMLLNEGQANESQIECGALQFFPILTRNHPQPNHKLFSYALP
jgi:hypothetical protein